MNDRLQADPLETPPPTFSLDSASSLAERLFGISGSASALDSERDQNFRITVDDGRSFVLKVANPADERAAIEMQNQAALHVAQRDPELPVMQPLESVDGERLVEVENGDTTYIVRLFNFLPGRMVPAAELGPRDLREFGAVVARMGIALRGFLHPAADYEILWDLKHTPGLESLLEHTRNPERRAVVAAVLRRFDSRVRDVLPGLRCQVVHNDLTVDNVLLDDSLRVSGIVDFGDTTHTALICDLAVSAASLMWERDDPLEAVAAAISGYTSVLAVEEAEADVLGDLILARLAASVLIANWRVAHYPENADYIMATEGVAGELLDRFDALGFAEVEARIRSACLRPTRAAAFDLSTEELRARRERSLGPALSPLTYDEPLYLVRGEGVQLFDSDGVAYLDAYNNVPVVGHSHPRVAAAIAEQSATLNTNTRYLHHAVVELAERLVATMPEDLDTVMFYNSGSEANDVAWRLARAYTGATGAIVSSYAYHGVTDATIALSPEGWQEGEHPHHVETIPAPDGYRGLHRREQAGWTDRYAAEFDGACARLQERGHRLAAFFVDSLFTSDGVFDVPGSYLAGICDRVRAAGGVVVADEVQCGFGRTGASLWSFAGSGITPDVVTLGKPMGNGYPVAAVVTRADIAARFAEHGDIFSTFGGNPVAARAALVVLDVIEDEDLVTNAEAAGGLLHHRLEGLKDRHDAIGDVRGMGLLAGVDLVRDRRSRAPDAGLAHDVMNLMKARGVLIGSTGAHDNVLKIRPPLVLTTTQAEMIADTLDSCLDELGR